MRVIALALAWIALGAAAPDDGAYFLGTWSCNGVAWTYTPLAPGSTWMRNTYGDPAKPDGSAVIGYVAGLHRWVYRDFHADGSYADMSSPPPVNGRWVWSGPYFPAGAATALEGRVTYSEVTPDRYDRTFEQLLDGKYIPHGGDSCRKTP